MAKKKTTGILISTKREELGQGKTAVTLSITIPEKSLELPDTLFAHGLYPALKDYLATGVSQLIDGYRSGAQVQLEKMKTSLSAESKSA